MWQFITLSWSVAESGKFSVPKNEDVDSSVWLVGACASHAALAIVGNLDKISWMWPLIEDSWALRIVYHNVSNPKSSLVFSVQYFFSFSLMK